VCKIPARLINSTLLAVTFSSLSVCTHSQPVSAGTTYYVDTNGSDSNSGTAASPWKTIQNAANTLQAGQTVVVKAGIYDERVQISKSGTPSSRITYQTQGTVFVNRGFKLQANYITLTGFDITNASGSSALDYPGGAGIYVTGSHSEIRDNYVHNTTAVGIYLTSSAANITIANNRISYAVQCGIFINGSNNLVDSNDIGHTRSVSGSDADGVRFFGSGSVVRRNHIHDLYISDSRRESPHIDAFQTWGPATNYIFEQNRIDKSTEQPQGFTIEGKYTPVDGIVIRNNLFITRGTDYQSNVNVGALGRVSNVTIANNTMISLNAVVESAILVQQYLTGAVIKNNLVYNHGNSATPYIEVDRRATSIDIGTNSVYNSNGVAPIGSPYAGDLWMVNPEFADFASRDFHLRPTSPLIDKGTSLSSVPNDMDSVSRPLGSGYDIGAYEKK
jgi:parallel beta-helix repeat protein